MPGAHPYSLWNSFVSKNMPAAKHQTLHTTKTTFDKLLIRLTKRTKTNYCKTLFSLSSVCLSLLPFVFAVLSILSFNGLHEWFIFSCFIQFGSSGANFWILINFVIWMKCVKSQRKFSLRSRNQMYFRSSLLSTRKVSFRVERSDEQKYDYVRRVKEILSRSHFLTP